MNAEAIACSMPPRIGRHWPLSRGCMTSEQPADRSSLPGYEAYKFGMSPQEAQRFGQLKLGPPKPEPSGVRLTAAEPVVIDGTGYELSLVFKDDRLSSIMFGFSKHDTDAFCQSQFRRAVESVKARYGAPDLEPIERPRENGGAQREASFTFEDGSSIAVFSMSSATMCIANVVYFAKKTGITS
jgi:hypothetical protein